MKKATMKDIAREAKVSVATVSYILNNVNNQVIKDETRCRVLETAKRLNYIPSLTARSLAKGNSGMVALLFNRSERDGLWRKMYYGMLAERAETLCKQAGLHLLVLGMDSERPTFDIVRQREVDGVLLVDVKREKFRDISVHFSIGVPIVLIDSYIDDPLFKKVVIDYRQAFALWMERSGGSGKQCFLVLDEFSNESMMTEIINASQLDSASVFVLSADSASGLPEFLLRQQGKSGVALNEFVGLFVANASQGLKLELTVFCTIGCPEILPPGVRTLRTEEDGGQLDVAFRIMRSMVESKHKDVDYLAVGTESGSYVPISLK